MKEIYTRRSVRRFQQIKVEKEKINQMLRAGMQAPSAMGERPWEFIQVESLPTLIELSRVSPYSRPIERAAGAIILLCDKEKLKTEYFWQQDMAACAENILLEAVTQQIGAVWIGISPVEEFVKNVKEIIELPENIIPFGIIAFGYPLTNIMASMKYDPAKVHIEKY